MLTASPTEGRYRRTFLALAMPFWSLLAGIKDSPEGPSRTAIAKVLFSTGPMFRLSTASPANQRIQSAGMPCLILALSGGKRSYRPFTASDIRANLRTFGGNCGNTHETWHVRSNEENITDPTCQPPSTTCRGPYGCPYRSHHLHAGQIQPTSVRAFRLCRDASTCSHSRFAKRLSLCRGSHFHRPPVSRDMLNCCDFAMQPSNHFFCTTLIQPPQRTRACRAPCIGHCSDCCLSEWLTVS